MHTPKILTNFFRIDLYPPENYTLKIYPYSKETLIGLREKYNDSHSFFRFGENIYGAWMDGDQIGGEDIEIKIDDSPEIISSLLKHIFFRTFLRNTNEIVPLSFHPLSFISPRDEHDAVRPLLPDDLKGVISYNRQFEIALRAILNSEGKLEYGFAINIEHRWNISENISQLRARGVDLIGLDVIHCTPIPGKEDILAPHESSLGKLLAIDGNQAIIDSNEGEINLPVSQVFLRRSSKSIKGLLSKLINDNSANYIIDNAKKNSRLKSNYDAYYAKINDIVKKRLSNWRYYSKDGFEFVLSLDSELEHLSYSLEENKFIFDYGTGSANTSIMKGLNEFGPFDSNSFTPKSPKILVICHPKSRGGYSKTMGALKAGLPESSFYRRGMKDMFRLQDMSFEFGEIIDSSYEGYLKVIKEKLAENNSYDLVLLEGTDREKYKNSKDNPYYRAKAYLLSKGIPVQALLESRTRKDSDLQFILSPLALQIYSKMGGIPWVLPSSNDVDWEIIIGISHTYIRSNSYKGGTESRLVGLTTFFSSDGNLLFSDNSRATDYENFFDELLLSLKSSINKLSEDMAWKKGQTVRFVFHVFKPMKGTELDVVKKLIKEFDNFSIQFAFLQIIEKHPFLLFDKHSKGVTSKDKVNKKYIPLRGTNLIINENECLLTTMGAAELRFASHSPSRPVLIRLHRDSTFKDMHHLTQQVFKFSHHSWRSINPNLMPVTLYYASMISNLLGNFRDIPDFSSEALLSAMKRKKWFL